MTQKAIFLKKKLNDLDTNYYPANLLNFLSFLLNRKNELIKICDTNLVLSLVKHVLKMNNNQIHSNLSDHLKPLIKKLISHFKGDDNPVIKRYTHPDSDITVNKRIPRRFGAFYHNGYQKTRIYTNEENLAYEESLFKIFQKILYYVNNFNFFNKSFIKNETGSLEYLSLFTGKLQPKVSLLLMRNVFHYCFRYPRRFFEYKTQCHKSFQEEPLFWVNDESEFDTKDDENEEVNVNLCIVSENEEHNNQRIFEDQLSVVLNSGPDDTQMIMRNVEDHNPQSDHNTTNKADIFKFNNIITDLGEITHKYSLVHTNKTKLSTIMKNLIMVQVKVFNNIVITNPGEVKNRESFYMRFFHNTVVYPSMIYIYKTILVTKTLSIMQKYEIYEIILNLLNSFAIFLEEITNPEMFNLDLIIDINEKRKFFKFEGDTEDQPGTTPQHMINLCYFLT